MVTVSAAIRMPLPPAPSDAAVGTHRDAGKKPAAYGAALQLIYQLDGDRRAGGAAGRVPRWSSVATLASKSCRIRRRVERDLAPSATSRWRRSTAIF